MIKVITYGTYDLLHYGHIRLLERAKSLGDYLIVGITADDFDKTRGKINVQQSLMERIEAVQSTGLADEIIVEEYEGQKIDDIRRYGVDIFTVGSDWAGRFDYLNEYCKVIYLDRTEGVSSSEIRSQQQQLRIGMVGDAIHLKKFLCESRYINGAKVVGICTDDLAELEDDMAALPEKTNDYNTLLEQVDAIYLISHPRQHYEQICRALEKGKHVLCESPIALSQKRCQELFTLARQKNCILMEALKTAYSTAYSRLLLLVKAGYIGEIISVDATCTSLKSFEGHSKRQMQKIWSSLYAWGPTALLPVFHLLGTDYKKMQIISKPLPGYPEIDLFTNINFVYPSAVASIKVGKGIKSEGELIVSGTKGYLYVPAPWWKTDYFEIRYEDLTRNRRYFYQLEGEGIRYEIVAFTKAALSQHGGTSYISENITEKICAVMGDTDRTIICDGKP